MDTLIARKYAVIEKLMHLNEEELSELEASLAKFEKEEAISAEQYDRELDEADAAIDRGKFYNHQEAVERLNQWKNK